MPGLQQLREFSSKITSLSGEPEIRKAKGQIMASVPLPRDLPNESDSEDFVFGLPGKDDPVTTTTFTPDASDLPVSDDIDIDALLAEAAASDPSPAPSSDSSPVDDDDIFNSDFSIPGFDSSTITTESDDVLSALADFDSSDAPSGEPEDLEDLEELEELDTTLSDLPLDELLNGSSKTAEVEAPAEDFAMPEDESPAEDFAIPEEEEPVVIPEDTAADDFAADFNGDFDAGLDTNPVIDDVAADFGEDTGSDTATSDAGIGLDDTSEFDMPAFDTSEFDFGSFDQPAESDDTAAADVASDDFASDLSEDIPSAEDADDGEIDITQNFSGEFASDAFVDSDFELGPASSDTNDQDSDFDLGDSDSGTENLTDDETGDAGDSVDTGFDDAGDMDFGTDDLDFGSFDASTDSTLDGLDFNFDDTASEASDTSSSPSDGGFSLPISDDTDETPVDFSGMDSGFDMPDGMDNLNFGDFAADSGDGFDNGSDDFSESDFKIPGFSDFDMGSGETPMAQIKPAGKGRKKKEEPVKRTGLTDEEYAIFKKNLAYYPLNLRVEIEELIVSNDFTDEVIFEIIEKVLKRIPARQLANQVEKLVDKHIPVPLNYEKRTAAEYEAYKQSLEYQLKNRVIPFAIGGVLAGLLIWLSVFLVSKFVVRPVRAELLYKEGYTLLENGLYPQSEQKFSEAVYYRPVKSWFYKYARGYRSERQYERAADTYEKLLRRYNYEKAAGLEYARMELDDLINYERAETVVRRWVLDYHINDPDAILLLGDIFLEWATATDDPDRYEAARLQYATLIEMYGRTDLYLSRMMRYFIRTDNIREVLPLKNYFYPKMENPKKNPLEGQDMVELSGYMMEKLYGYLAPQDEFLRSSIEDVRDMLEKAVQQAPEIPESVYNFGRYFVETGNTSSAKKVLTEALNRFESAEQKSHQRITRYINTYRLLGELHAGDQEYLKARELYTEGLELFLREQQYSALPTNEYFGHLYADMADLDYFISGDLDTALVNYNHAINNEYDTPSIRYRVGYIQYNRGNYREALGSFVKTVNEVPSEQNALLALGNTLTLRGSTQAARGYYEKLIDILELQRVQEGILFPQVQEDHQILVDTYMKAANNLAVVLSRLASQTGDSSLNGKAMVYLQESVRAWDALTRNQTTMIRLEGSNLAQQNLRYMTVPNSTFESEIYTSLPRTLLGESTLTQSAISGR